MKRLLVLGVGNLLLTDDGVGVHAVQDLGREEEWDLEKVDFLDGATFTQDIFYIFQRYELVLVLDTVKGGREPGTVYRFTEENLRDNYQQRLSLHDIDLLDSLKMAELLGNKPQLAGHRHGAPDHQRLVHGAVRAGQGEVSQVSGGRAAGDSRPAGLKA
jgi:hydrogenase maturation protease